MNAFGSRKMPPARIVFYRDGLFKVEFEVSEHRRSRLSKVSIHNYAHHFHVDPLVLSDAIHTAWDRKRAHSINKPMITYIVIGKFLKHPDLFMVQDGRCNVKGRAALWVHRYATTLPSFLFI